MFVKLSRVEFGFPENTGSTKSSHIGMKSCCPNVVYVAENPISFQKWQKKTNLSEITFLPVKATSDQKNTLWH
jgi:hypothetical protein